MNPSRKNLLANTGTLAACLLALFAGLLILVNLLAIWNLQYPYFRNDDWNLYSDLHELGPLTFLIHKYFGHAIFFPKLVLLANLAWFSGTSQAVVGLGMILNVLMATLLAGTLWHARSRQAPASMAILGAILVAGSILWMVRHMEFTWPPVIMTLLAVVAGTMAAWCFYRHLLASGSRAGLPTDRWWWLMVLACITSTFSFGGGFATWPGIALVMLMYGLALRRIAVFLAVGTIAVLLAIATPPHEQLEIVRTWIATPGEFIQYLLVFLGLAFNFSLFPFEDQQTGSPLMSAILGALGILILTTYSWWQYRQPRPLPPVLAFPLALAWFALFAAVAASLGRAGAIDLFSNPNNYRFNTWSVIFWAPLLWLALYHALQQPLQRRLHQALFLAGATLVAGLFAAASFHGISYLLTSGYEHRQGGLAMIVAPEMRGGDARHLAPLGARSVLRQIDRAREQRHNLFAQRWAHHTGESLSAHYTISARTDCIGNWHWRRDMQSLRSRAYEGWATGPSGGFDTLLLVVDETIVGAAGPVWLENRRDVAGEHISTPGNLRYLLSVLTGNNPGWLGITNMSYAPAGAEIVVYGLLGGDKACLVHRVDRASR